MKVTRAPPEISPTQKLTPSFGVLQCSGTITWGVFSEQVFRFVLPDRRAERMTLTNTVYGCRIKESNALTDGALFYCLWLFVPLDSSGGALCLSQLLRPISALPLLSPNQNRPAQVLAFSEQLGVC